MVCALLQDEQGNRELVRRLEQHLGPKCRDLGVIHIVRIGIVDPTAAIVIAGGNSDAQFVIYEREIDCRACATGRAALVNRAHLSRRVRGKQMEVGGGCDIADGAAHRLIPVKGRLGAPQHFDAIKVQQSHVEPRACAGRVDRHFVDIVADRGQSQVLGNPTQGNSLLADARIDHPESRNGRLQVIEGVQAALFDVGRRHGRH